LACATPFANEAADRGARKTRCDTLAGAAAELRADQTASNSADERAGVFLRSLAGFGSTGACRHPQRDKRGSTQANERHVTSPHDDPVSDFNGSAFPHFGRCLLFS